MLVGQAWFNIAQVWCTCSLVWLICWPGLVRVFQGLLYLFARSGLRVSLVWFIACGFAVAKDMICENLSRDVMLAGAVILLILAVARYMVSMDAYDFIASMYLGMAFLLSTCWAQGLTVQINRSLKKVVHFIAGYSFTLFLTHYSVLYFINATGLLHGWAALLISFFASNLIAVLIAYWTEMRYRDFAKYLRKQWASISAYSPG